MVLTELGAKLDAVAAVRPAPALSGTAPVQQPESTRTSAPPVQGERTLNDKAAAGRPPEGDRLSRVVEELNEMVVQVRRELRFSIDEDSGEMIIKVIDAETHEVVRNIPPDQVLTLKERLDSGRSLLVNATA